MIRRIFCMGKELREARRGMGLTQKEAADLSGVDREVLASYESDACRPSEADLGKLANLYRVSLAGVEVCA